MSFLEQVNPQQKEAIKTVQGPVMVIAGPGSGKTRVLTFRITYLISIGVPAVIGKEGILQAGMGQ
jgi:DNA helicase-2/ATP-dependent DNA helicase PcrA